MADDASGVKVKVLGWIHVVLGGGGLLAGSALCLGLAADPQGGPALYYVGPLFGMLATVFFGPGLLGGAGLVAGQRWARVLVGLLSVLLLLAIPIGTVLGGFGLWVLAGAKPPPAPPRPAMIVGGNLTPQARNLLGLATIAGAVAAGFVFAIGLGFRLHDQSPPAPFSWGFYPAAVALVALLAFALVVRPFGQDPPGPRSNLSPLARHRLRQAERRAYEAVLEAERRRRAEIAADPVRRKYLALMDAGQPWSDEQIAYDLDPEALVTCEHLRRLERAMRGIGPLHVRYMGPTSVSAHCLVDEPALRARFDLSPQVMYFEFFLGDRSPEDFPVAQLACMACKSVIETTPSLEVKPDTPRFPADG